MTATLPEGSEGQTTQKRGRPQSAVVSSPIGPVLQSVGFSRGGMLQHSSAGPQQHGHTFRGTQGPFGGGVNAAQLALARGAPWPRGQVFPAPPPAAFRWAPPAALGWAAPYGCRRCGRSGHLPVECPAASNAGLYAMAAAASPAPAPAPAPVPVYAGGFFGPPPPVPLYAVLPPPPPPPSAQFQSLVSSPGAAAAAAALAPAAVAFFGGSADNPGAPAAAHGAGATSAVGLSRSSSAADAGEGSAPKRLRVSVGSAPAEAVHPPEARAGRGDGALAGGSMVEAANDPPRPGGRMGPSIERPAATNGTGMCIRTYVFEQSTVNPFD